MFSNRPPPMLKDEERAKELREITCSLCKPSTHNPTPTICTCEKLRSWGDPPPNHERIPHHHWSDETDKEYIAKCTSKAEEIMPILAQMRLEGLREAAEIATGWGAKGTAHYRIKELIEERISALEALAGKGK